MLLLKFQAPAAKLDASSTIHYEIFVTKNMKKKKLKISVKM